MHIFLGNQIQTKEFHSSENGSDLYFGGRGIQISAWALFILNYVFLFLFYYFVPPAK
jgi:uncharacterized BrkB/YihY/UPF0761 family membrane protein